MSTLRQRAFGLIEVILAVAITLSLLIGGLLLFNQSSLASATSETGRMVTAMTSEARSMFRMAASFDPATGDELSSHLLISAGSIPANAVDQINQTIVLSYGGVLDIAPHPGGPADNMLITIAFPMSRDAVSLCNRLAAHPATDGAGPLGVGYRVENACAEAMPTLYATFSRAGNTPPLLAR